MRPVIVQRFHKHEIDQAISELIDRGFELICPPVQQTMEGNNTNLLVAEEEHSVKTSRKQSGWLN